MPNFIVDGSYSESDMFDEMLRQIQKTSAYEKDGAKSILLGHPDLHRLLKDMVKAESASKDELA